MNPAGFERRTSPRHRPPVALRAFSALLSLAAFAFAAALMLSDRAPSALRRLFGEDVRRLWDRIDANQRAQLVNEADLPQADFVVHVIVWSVVLVLVAMAVWTWRWLIVAVVGVFACSVVIELAQARYSDTRSVELDDVVGNAVGVAVGAGAVVLLYLGWSALALVVNDVHQT